MRPTRLPLLRADDIVEFRTAARDYAGTQALKARIRELRLTRVPFWIDRPGLDEIFRWKLEDQFGRQESIRASTPDAFLRAVTRATFEIEDGGSDREAGLRIGLLSALPGVGVPVASAVLALVDPERYCVIDYRGWRSVFGEDRDGFTIPQYLDYRRTITAMAAPLGWQVQEVDLAVWAYDSAKYRRQRCG